MEKQQIEKVETQVLELHKNLQNLTEQDSVLDLIKIIHQPGFTTPAEALFVAGVVEAMHAHTSVLASLKKTLLTASSNVRINPQPLPPLA